MSVYDYEIVKLNGEYKCYVRIQNDWTGQIRDWLRDIFLDGDIYYCRADGQRLNLNAALQKYKLREDEIKTALDWYRKTKF